MSRAEGRVLVPAAVAVMLAAADTYVVVLALPDMMTAVGLGVEQLQRAAPIVSGFLLGYVAVLPLIGRVADLRGRTPVLVATLWVFALGSLITAAAYDLPSLVTGRFLQGVGGGGLVPVTLALVADRYPVERRSVPLGVVGAVQELGSVLGPLLGALVLTVGTWRDIFWLNLAAGVALALAAGVLGGRARRRPDPVGAALAAASLVGVLLVMRQPQALITSVAWGGPFVPFGAAGTPAGSVWCSPLGLVTALLVFATVVWCALGSRVPGPLGGHPLVDLAGWWSAFRRADLPGALLLAVALGGVVLAFAAADPAVATLSPAGPWLLLGSAVAAALLLWHLRRTPEPLVPRGLLRARPAWGAVLVSLLAGAGLVAALVDVPIFARVSGYADTQLGAALVLLQLLVALPVGAVAGGRLARRTPAGVVAAAGMALGTVGFVVMSGWGTASLGHPGASLVLVVTGLGFGLALAPVNAALLASTAPQAHGVAGALLVVGRMVGMLVGLSALTTIGLRRYYAVSASLPAPGAVCPSGRTSCPAYSALLRHAGLEQLQAVFLGAAVCVALSGLLALALFRGAPTRGRAHLVGPLPPVS